MGKRDREKGDVEDKLPRRSMNKEDMISEDDFFIYNKEFKYWLKSRDKSFEDMKTSKGTYAQDVCIEYIPHVVFLCKAKEYFEKFVRYWNEGRLNDGE
jgi:hypothetical protein